MSDRQTNTIINSTTSDSQEADRVSAPAGAASPTVSPAADSSEHDPFATGGRSSWLGFTLAIVIALIIGLIGGARWHDVIGHWLGLHSHGAETNAQAPGAKQLWTCGMHPQVIQDHPGTCPICGMALEPVKAGNTGALASSGERKVKYWWDPMMNPPYISDKPGKSPMGMDLAPVYEDEISGGTAVQIDPVIVQNMGVRVARVSKGPVRQAVRAVGYLEEAQPNIVDINLRVSGWVEKLHSHTAGMHVSKGDPLFELYSPEIQVAVGELINARRAREALRPDADESARKSAQILYQVAERKLDQWGLAREQIEQLAKADNPPRTVTFRSPITGDVTEKTIVEGAAVKAGDRILQLVDHSTLWLDAQIYAQDLAATKLGQPVSATIEGMAGRQFDGQIIFIHPHVDPTTRTAKVRMALPNPTLTLRPGMYATVQIDAELAGDALLVPKEAVLDTGTRQVAFVSLGNGHFEPRKVKTGLSASDGNIQILEGLAPGETVVTSGQFLLDAESRMKEAIQKHLSEQLLKSPAAATASATQQPQGAQAGDPHANHRANVSPASSSLGHGHWTQHVDALVLAYLEISEPLGAAQQADTPVDPHKLQAAAASLAKHLPSEELKPVVESVSTGATAMAGQPLAQQRKQFASISDAVIKLIDRLPPSQAVADKLYVVHCSMAPGTWLQKTSQVANPYYATSMKRCGQVEREITLTGDH